MLPSKWENLSRCSTKLIHVCKKLGTEYYVQRYWVMKSSTLKLHKSQRKMNYTRQNENSLDSLASNITSDII